jgi:hypothetical protein
MRMQQPPRLAFLLAAFALLMVAYLLAASLSGIHAAPGPVLFESPA